MYVCVCLVCAVLVDLFVSAFTLLFSASIKFQNFVIGIFVGIFLLALVSFSVRFCPPAS